MLDFKCVKPPYTLAWSQKRSAKFRSYYVCPKFKQEKYSSKIKGQNYLYFGPSKEYPSPQSGDIVST